MAFISAEELATQTIASLRRMESKNIDRGVVFCANVDNICRFESFTTDGDNALYTGMALAAACKTLDALPPSLSVHEKPLAELASKLIYGLHRLTHASPVPGVLARTVFPREHSEEHGFVGISGPSDNWWTQQKQLYTSKDDIYQTRTTRDQLTGVLLGLTYARKVLPFFDEMTQNDWCETVEHLHSRLSSTSWSLKDHTGKTGTNAHNATWANKKTLKSLALYKMNLHKPIVIKEMLAKAKVPMNSFSHTFYYCRCFARPFAWNLRYLEALTLHELGYNVEGWTHSLYGTTFKMRNPFFNLVAALILPSGQTVSPAKSFDAIQQYHEAFIHPKFFRWEKDKKEWTQSNKGKYGPELSFSFPASLVLELLQRRVLW